MAHPLAVGNVLISAAQLARDTAAVSRASCQGPGKVVRQRSKIGGGWRDTPARGQWHRRGGVICRHAHALRRPLDLDGSDFAGALGQLLTARDLKHQPLRVTVDPASPARTIAVIPDAWLQLHVAGAGTYSIAVELDHGTEHRPRWQTKVAAWAPPAPTRRPLTPTTSPSPSSPPARRDALAGWTRQALTAYGQPELADIFLLSCADPATTPAEQWFFQPHWHQPNTGQPVSLLEPAPVRQPLPDSS